MVPFLFKCLKCRKRKGTGASEGSNPRPVGSASTRDYYVRGTHSPRRCRLRVPAVISGYPAALHACTIMLIVIVSVPSILLNVSLSSGVMLSTVTHVRHLNPVRGCGCAAIASCRVNFLGICYFVVPLSLIPKCLRVFIRSVVVIPFAIAKCMGSLPA